MRACLICAKPVTGKGRKNCPGECQRIYREQYRTAYRLNNRGKTAAYNNSRRDQQREYYRENREKIIRYQHENREIHRVRLRERLETDVGRRMAYLCKARASDARKRGVAFDLTPEFITGLYDTQGGRCAVTGIAFDLTMSHEYRSAPFSPSIDRINAREGYLCSNVQLVCFAVNMGKGEYPLRVFDAICRARVEQLNRGQT